MGMTSFAAGRRAGGPPSRRPLLSLCLVAGALLPACTAGWVHDGSEEEELEDPGSPGASGPAAPGAPAPGGASNPGLPSGATPAANLPNVPGPAPLRRLTVREYNNTVRDLLGVSASSTRDFAVDRDSGGFAVGGPITTSTDVAKLVDAADQLAASAAGKLEGLLPCTPVPAAEGAQAECARAFITKFGRRAFRRPLADDEVNDLAAVYASHRGAEIGYDFPAAIRAVVAAMLSSPSFLYRAELGSAKPLREAEPIKDSVLIRFNPHEMASRLSYALWGTMPDDQLFAEADAGRLGTPAEVEAQARRMLKDGKLRDTLSDFHQQWLDIHHLPAAQPKDARYAAYTPALVQAMLDETVNFVADLYLGGDADGSFERLLTGNTTTVDPALAKLYGVTMAGTGAQKVTLPAAERAGILTHASFLAMHADAAESNPVRRGAVLLGRLFCMEVQPPPDVDVAPPKPPAEGLTTRERFAAHAQNPCASCHRLTDPLGFALEHYDAIGAYRQNERGKPVDASGNFPLPSGGQIQFQNAIELVRGMTRADDVRSCLATQWLRYFLRRHELPGDGASLQLGTQAFGKAGHDMRELLIGLVRTRAFTHRTPSFGEVLP